MARRDPQLTPSGDAEQALYDAINDKFARIADFVRAVAERSGNTEASEKGTLYRYIRGGPIPRDRLAVYAAILNRDSEEFTRPPSPATAHPVALTSALHLSLLLLRDLRTWTPEIRTMVEALADEGERSAREMLRAVEGLRDQLSQQGHA